MKNILFFTLTFITANFAMALACPIDLSNSDMYHQELIQVQPTLTAKGFIPCPEQDGSCMVSVSVKNTNESFRRCQVTISLQRNGIEFSTVTKEISISIGHDRCSSALVEAVKAIPSCEKLSK